MNKKQILRTENSRREKEKSSSDSSYRITNREPIGLDLPNKIKPILRNNIDHLVRRSWQRLLLKFRSTDLYARQDHWDYPRNKSPILGQKEKNETRLVKKKKSSPPLSRRIKRDQSCSPPSPISFDDEGKIKIKTTTDRETERAEVDHPPEEKISHSVYAYNVHRTVLLLKKKKEKRFTRRTSPLSSPRTDISRVLWFLGAAIIPREAQPIKGSEGRFRELNYRGVAGNVFNIFMAAEFRIGGKNMVETVVADTMSKPTKLHVSIQCITRCAPVIPRIYASSLPSSSSPPLFSFSRRRLFSIRLSVRLDKILVVSWPILFHRYR